MTTWQLVIVCATVFLTGLVCTSMVVEALKAKWAEEHRISESRETGRWTSSAKAA